MQKDRDSSFDAFRGFTIIAVVAAHAVIPGSYWCDYWDFRYLFYRQLFNFPVPVFLFISGYWLSKKPIKSLGDYKAFLTRRLSRILIPYLFWSFILLGYAAIKTHDINVYRIIRELLTGGACIPYFFIIMIVQLYIMTPVLQYINRKSYGLMLVLTFNVISLLALYLSRLYHVIWHLPASLPFYSWIIFYEIGLLIGSRDNKIFVPKSMRFFILPAILVFLLLSELEGMIILSKYDNLNFAISSTKYSSILYSVCIIIGFLFVRERLRYWPKFLVTMGNCSFGIYLIHVPVLNRIINVVQKTNIIYSFQPLYQFTAVLIIVVLITISICFVLISITRKLLPKSFCSKVLGF